MSIFVPRKVWVKVKVPFLPSLWVGLPSIVKTEVETQRLRATDGSLVSVTFPFFTVNWTFRKAELTACWVVEPLYLPLFTATPASATPAARRTRPASTAAMSSFPTALRAMDPTILPLGGRFPGISCPANGRRPRLPLLPDHRRGRAWTCGLRGRAQPRLPGQPPALPGTLAAGPA